jgi:hypothetical protein
MEGGMMNQRERAALDRHITGNYGEDQLRREPGMCIWDDCDQEAIYCEGHAREYAVPTKLSPEEVANVIFDTIKHGDEKHQQWLFNKSREIATILTRSTDRRE